MGALRLGKDAIRAGKGACAVLFELVEGAGRGKALDDALVDRARIDPRGEVADAGERLVAARGDDDLDGLRADALERGERVVDGVVADLEGHVRPVDRRRIDLDAEAQRLGAE